MPKSSNSKWSGCRLFRWRDVWSQSLCLNFNKEELLEAIDYVHLYGKKLFLTVNTLMKEEELPLLPGFLKPFYEQGLDAVIVQDLGAVSVIRKHFSETWEFMST